MLARIRKINVAVPESRREADHNSLDRAPCPAPARSRAFETFIPGNRSCPNVPRAAQFFRFPLPLWAVLTAVIVTQMSVGRSLKATADYLAGTLGGALYGGAIAVLVPHSSEIALLAVLALAVARSPWSQR